MNHLPDEITLAVLDQRPGFAPAKTAIGALQPVRQILGGNHLQKGLNQPDSLGDLRPHRAGQLVLALICGQRAFGEVGQPGEGATIQPDRAPPGVQSCAAVFSPLPGGGFLDKQGSHNINC